jgi:hypothetical protein
MKFEFVLKLFIYLVDRLQNLEAPISTIRVIKLLYLIDLEYFKHYKTTLTTIEWVRYKFGPYFFAATDVIRSSGIELEMVETARDVGFTRTFKSSKPQDISKDVPFATESLINRITEQWAHENLKTILKFVYNTQPVKETDFGKPIDFSISIPTITPKKRKFQIKLDAEDSLIIQSLLESRKIVPKTQIKDYDDLYFEAIKLLAMEENIGTILPVTVNFSYEAMETIKNQLE